MYTAISDVVFGNLDLLDDVLPLTVLGLGAGTLIGSIGIGGVIVVPLLTLTGRISVIEAIATAMFAYILGGMSGLYFYSRRGNSVPFARALALCTGAAPASFLGAYIVTAINTNILKLGLFMLMAASGTYSAWQLWIEWNEIDHHYEVVASDEFEMLKLAGAQVDSEDETLAKFRVSNRAVLAYDPELINSETQPWRTHVVHTCIGFATGICSALTGTCGPIILLPLLLALKWEIMFSLACAQFIQIPIAASSTLATLIFHSQDLHLRYSLWLGIPLAIGVGCGSHIAHHVQSRVIKALVVTALVLCAFILLGSSLIQMYT